MADDGRRKPGILGRLKSALGEGETQSRPERRTSKRVKLPIPVHLQVGSAQPEMHRLRDISQQSLCVEASGGAIGDRVVVRFDGYPDVCDPFSLEGEIVRATDDAPPGLVVHIDRKATPAEALGQYRTLVLHYIRHRPLLDEVGSGYFEGRCESCGWIGRVGEKKPRCSRCGEPVVPVGGDHPRS